MPIAETFQDRVDGVSRVLEYLAAGQQSAKNIHKHHLSRIVAEMLTIKWHDDFGLIRFKASFHHAASVPSVLRWKLSGISSGANHI